MAGLNTEITRNKSQYHIQTQDKGPGALYVESIIYKSGRVLSSRRAFYTAFLNNYNLQGKIGEIIQQQHNQILSEIKDGKYDNL